jgi:hypothetical protein
MLPKSSNKKIQKMGLQPLKTVFLNFNFVWEHFASKASLDF